MFSRDQLKRAASLTEEDFVQLGRCRRPHNRLGFALSECDPVANGIDLSLLEHVSPIEWDNVVLYGQYILDRKLVRRRRRAKRVVLSA
jgi:hypothetical protein